MRDGCFSGNHLRQLSDLDMWALLAANAFPAVCSAWPLKCFFAHKTCIYILYDSITHGFFFTRPGALVAERRDGAGKFVRSRRLKASCVRTYGKTTPACNAKDGL